MTEPYYGKQAYNSQQIPRQPKAADRSWLSKQVYSRLPWGNTQPTAATNFIKGMTPQELNDMEQVRKELAAEKNKAQVVSIFNHQELSYIPVALRTRNIMIVNVFGRFWATSKITISIFIFCSILFQILYSRDMDPNMPLDPNTPSRLHVLFVGFCIYLVMGPVPWLITYIIMNWLPSFIWAGAGRKGKIWEFNRQTGIVTLYKRRKPLFSAPFYEWDAYLGSMPSQSGVIWYYPVLAHRYQPHKLDFSILSVAGPDQNQALGAWDFVQNFMDTSKPLPDLPVFELDRTKDPVTAEYDQKTNRNPRYWRDMNEQDFEQTTKALEQLRSNLDTMKNRRNIMANYVQYSD